MKNDSTTPTITEQLKRLRQKISSLPPSPYKAPKPDQQAARIMRESKGWE